MREEQFKQILKVIEVIKTNPAGTSTEVAHRAGMSRPTFYRRLDEAAKLLGFHARHDQRDKTYRITEGHFGPVFQLSPLEVFSFIMAARHLSVAGDHTLAFDAITAIRRIAATGPKSLRNFFDYLLADVVLEKSYAVSPEILDPLREAVEKRLTVEIDYQEQMSGGTVKQFTVEPQHVLFKWRALYLDGYCPEEGKYLMFRLSRIKGVKLLRLKAGRDRPPYDFARRHGNSFRVYVSDDDPKEVRVKFSPKFAPMIAESFWHPSERKDTLEDGSLILSVTVSYPPEVVWWALQWGAEAEVLSPPEMRELAAETAAQMVAVYQKSIRGKHG